MRGDLVVANVILPADAELLTTSVEHIVVMSTVNCALEPVVCDE